MPNLQRIWQEGGAVPTCKSCGKRIEFITLESGKKAPVDLPGAAWSARMGENQIVKVRGRPGFVMKVPEEGPLVEVFTSHFVTCPDAQKFRKN